LTFILKTSLQAENNVPRVSSFPVNIPPRVEDQVILSSSGFQETSTDSNHLDALVTPELVEIDTNSPPEVLIFDIKIISSFYQNFNIHYFFCIVPFFLSISNFLGKCSSG
jgi:hypothetical protein